MRTRSQSREQHPPPPEEPPVVIEPLRIEYPFQEDPPVEPMADTRTMAQLLQAPTEGYEDAILIPEIVANLGMSIKASVKLISKLKSLKIS
ncbi:hypothetical protein Tco_1572474 [Tanacetum coccineum]